MDLETLKHQVRFGARSLQRKLNDIWGHVSVRLPAGSDQEGFVLAHLRIPFKPAPPDELYCLIIKDACLRERGSFPGRSRCTPTFTGCGRTWEVSSTPIPR